MTIVEKHAATQLEVNDNVKQIQQEHISSASILSSKIQSEVDLSLQRCTSNAEEMAAETNMLLDISAEEIEDMLSSMLDAAVLEVSQSQEAISAAVAGYSTDTLQRAESAISALENLTSTA